MKRDYYTLLLGLPLWIR